MRSRDFYFRRLVLSVGDIVYCVTGCEATYSIKKTRIADILTRTRGLGIHGLKMDYTVYLTEDGQVISRSFIEKRDEMSPDQVFLSKGDAVQYVKECLRKEINRERHALLNAQERLARAERGCAAYLLDILIGMIYWGVVGFLAFFGAFLYGKGTMVLPIVIWALAGILMLLIPLIQHWFRKKYGKKIDIWK